jgi:hypothetical protein
MVERRDCLVAPIEKNTPNKSIPEAVHADGVESEEIRIRIAVQTQQVFLCKSFHLYNPSEKKTAKKHLPQIQNKVKLVYTLTRCREDCKDESVRLVRA